MLIMEEILSKIEELRNLMHRLIEEKELLTDTELVSLSQELDKHLNKYNRLLNIKRESENNENKRSNK
ncbi:aspartyl-phosphate phosphatase Spo0E family protein [Clostridium sp. OS1-26]|uniref:aspartyl-phosphate phosphatase Spo0E family protein n=1 Tax=Clostridium sp. OS1-26 TaxID=3070681 RepID=UPI0027E179DA|nr:aspartyl-phosphate phosphatase Spo0E family protein [Clostridium sp. OS1-26]WML37562.1 aspartyl-phosphate phosphatase Spo0E family protein [Clostridium sp. OS1-26]